MPAIAQRVSQPLVMSSVVVPAKRRESGVRSLPSTQRGFTYLLALFVVAILGATLALTGTVWHTEVRREKEVELLFVGGEYRRAIKSYYQAGGQYPARLEDLLKDPRQPTTVRYLRKLYPDPITGKPVWGLVRGPNNSIIGVFSISKEAPLKIAGFTLTDKDFEGKVTYSEWQFMGIPEVPGMGTPAVKLDPSVKTIMY